MIVIQMQNGPAEQVQPTQFVRVPAIGEVIVGTDGVQHSVINIIHQITPQGPELIVVIQ